MNHNYLHIIFTLTLLSQFSLGLKCRTCVVSIDENGVTEGSCEEEDPYKEFDIFHENEDPLNIFKISNDPNVCIKTTVKIRQGEKLSTVISKFGRRAPENWIKQIFLDTFLENELLCVDVPETQVKPKDGGIIEMILRATSIETTSSLQNCYCITDWCNDDPEFGLKIGSVIQI